MNELEKSLNELEEIRKKKLEIEKHKVNQLYNETVKNNQHVENFENLDIKFGSLEFVEKIQTRLDDYSKNLYNSPVFMNDSFKGVLPYCPRQIILLGAKTGDGKSTTAANLALQTIRQENQKCYVITNEESTDDVYNRVTSLIKGWSYSNHTEIPKERWATYREFIKILSTRLVVIDNNYNGANDLTTSLEGIEGILKNIHKSGDQVGAIILDYYQNVTFSKKMPHLKDLDVQKKLSTLLDSYKNVIKAPIVVMAQIHPESKERPSFKERIEGRKIINNVSTIAIEVKAVKEDLATDFVLHKNRFSEFANFTVRCGFNRGRYVEYTPEFAIQAEMAKQRRETAKLVKKTVKDDGTK